MGSSSRQLQATSPYTVFDNIDNVIMRQTGSDADEEVNGCRCIQESERVVLGDIITA